MRSDSVSISSTFGGIGEVRKPRICDVCGTADNTHCHHGWMAFRWYAEHVPGFLEFMRGRIASSVTQAYFPDPENNTVRFEDATYQTLWEVYQFGYTKRGRG